MSEWISVEDRLPENEGRVLVFDADDHEIHVGYYSSKYGWEIYDFQFYEITHWQPLPEPPK